MNTSSYLNEDFYYCESSFLINENPTRIFRIAHISTDVEDGCVYFYPMKDYVFVTEADCDANGTVYVNETVDVFKKASYKNIKNYIEKAYAKYQTEEATMALHSNTRMLKELYLNMKKEFKQRSIFTGFLNELNGFDERDIYTDSDRYLLNLLRSYYKCRILKH